MRVKAYETARWRARNEAMHCRHQHQREGSYTYNDPYHESPVDFDKYDEMNTADTTDKSNTKDAIITADAVANRYWALYHENPIDFDKYDKMVNTETTCKWTTKRTIKTVTMTTDAIADRCWVDIDPLLEINRPKKQRKGDEPPERCLATGCAADFERFPRIVEFLESDLD